MGKLSYIYRYISIIIVSVFSFSCREEGIDSPDTFDRVVVVYLAGDNNLSSEVDIKISALKYGLRFIDNRVNRVVVYADYVDSMPKIIELGVDENKVVRSYAALNSADPTIMNGVLKDIMGMYPANSYGLIVFSHATGWLPEGVYGQNYAELDGEKEDVQSTRSIFVDGEDEMAISDFSKCLPLPSQGKYDFIIFEACLMSGIEVAYELKDATDYIVSSSAEVLSPGFIDCYSSSLDCLFSEKPDLKRFCEKYYELYNAESGARQSATISLIRTEGLNSLANEIATILNAPQKSFDLSKIQHFDRTNQHIFYDLSDYLEAVSTVSLESYYNSLHNTVVYAASTPYFMKGYPYSFPIDSHSGLTIYVGAPEYEYLNVAYRELGFVKLINNN